MNRAVLLGLCLLLALAACGRKGDLELPSGSDPDFEERPAPEVG